MNRILVCTPSVDTTSPTSVAQQLRTEGFEVEERQSLPDITSLRNALVDLIILEVNERTYSDSYTWVTQLHQKSPDEPIPILLLGQPEHHTAVAHAEPSITTYAPATDPRDSTLQKCYYLIEGIHHGASDYLSAPFHITELLTKIQVSLRTKQTLSQAQALAQQAYDTNQELIQRNLQVEKEMYMARQLQQSLLPPAVIEPDETKDDAPLMTRVHYNTDKLRVSGVYLPCDALGGDLYDMIPFHDNAIGVAIADVSGHGLAAGFVTAIFKTSLYRATHIKHEPSEVVHQLNNELCDIIKTGDYVTGVYFRINLDDLSAAYAGAGHPYPFYYCAETNTVSRLTENSTPLGWVKDMDFPQGTFTLKPGDKVFMFSDGVSELRNFSGDMFGEEKIGEMLIRSVEWGSPYPTDDLIATLSDFTEGCPLGDDISMVLIEAF